MTSTDGDVAGPDGGRGAPVVVDRVRGVDRVDVVAALRRFNRSFTRRIGVLEESYLGTGRSLASSRLLFEIAHDGTLVGDLRRRLDLDSGYLSRLLRTLEDDRLVEVIDDPDDGRRRLVRLTSRGRRERSELDARSDAAAARLLEPLDPGRRRRLADALVTAERLLRAASVTLLTVDPTDERAAWALDRYFAELDARFPDGFDPGDAGSAHDVASLRSPEGAFVVAIGDGQVAGCGGVQRLDRDTAEIKRMWIAPDWRGLGLGRRVLDHLESIAAEHGRRRVVLDTNATLDEAIAMYERAGYRPIERYNDNPYAERWFAKALASP